MTEAQEELKRLPKTYQKFCQTHPNLIEAYNQLNDQVKAVDALTEEELTLVKLGISIGAGMDGAMASHMRKALAQGLDRKKIEQVALLALPTLGLPRMMQAWKNVTQLFEKADRKNP